MLVDLARFELEFVLGKRAETRDLFIIMPWLQGFLEYMLRTSVLL